MESSEQKKSDMVTELGSAKTGSIYTLTIIGQVEGHQVLPETAVLFDTIAVSAGERGHQMEVPPMELLELVDGVLADLTT